MPAHTAERQLTRLPSGQGKTAYRLGVLSGPPAECGPVGKQQALAENASRLGKVSSQARGTMTMGYMLLVLKVAQSRARPRPEPPPWPGSWKLGPWARPAPWGLACARKLPPAVAARPWRRRARLPALCSATATAQAPQVHSQLWIRAPRGLAYFLVKLPQEARRATPFPLFPERAGSTEAWAFSSSRGHADSSGPARPRHTSVPTTTNGDESPLLDPAKGPKPAPPGPSCGPETFWREQPRAHGARVVSAASWHEARPGRGWGTENQEGGLRGRVSADAVHSLPPSQPHSDVQDTRCGWQAARVPAGRPPPSGVPGAQDGRERTEDRGWHCALSRGTKCVHTPQRRSQFPRPAAGGGNTDSSRREAAKYNAERQPGCHGLQRLPRERFPSQKQPGCPRGELLVWGGGSSVPTGRPRPALP
ncbi:collagen alpha-1(I) chain-like [Lutra lutra]|uniref:collagen alpha-1(I) chain-like n=1 Tax=Lutra lutra TaxID=9657 RepID=UPI001FD3F05C|nr:collagen alpha-1(I) chain-like [Lutra lutra]